MALVVEDGSGLANAESYASADETAAYFTLRGKGDAWSDLEDQEAALRLATDYMAQVYRGQWAGMRTTATQALDWPRTDVPWEDSPAGVYASDVIPVEVKQACMELALRTASTDLLADTGRETLSESVDVISVTYAKGSSQQTQFAAVNALLKTLLVGGGGVIPMERA